MPAADDLTPEQLKEIADALIGVERRKGQTFDQAVVAAREKMSFVGESELDTVFAALEEERRRRITQPLDFKDITVADREDLKDSGWYEGPSDSGVWAALRERMEGSSLAGAVADIDRSSTEVVRRLAQPHSTNDRRRGVVIGNVQSGKTANYAAVIAKAADAGYQLIIVLSGIHNNLRSQTQSRLDRDLGVDTGTGKWHRLTDKDSDFGQAEAKNATSTLTHVPHVLAVVKKNSHRLRNLLAFLEEVDDVVMSKVPVLIIDDESDQATPDSSDKDADEPTAINRLLRQIWKRVSNGAYVGYTATPFANFFMDPENDRDPELPGLYPEDFIHAMPTPEAYFGAERIFGISAEDPETEDAAVAAELDVVRKIGEEELPSLRPEKRTEAEDFPAAVTDSLETAIRWFIIATAIRRVRGQKQSHSTMLVHTTHYTSPHFTMRDAIDQYVNSLREESMIDGDVTSFQKVFQSERDRAAHLYHGDSGAVTWHQVAAEILEVLRQLKVVVDNGKENSADRLDYSRGPQTVIVIGGGTLSRGLTLEGLFVSFFTRSSSAYDTLLQMGRWFGYRPGYEDLQRIWVSPGLDQDYSFLARVESEMREEIHRMTVENATPREIGVKIRQHPGRLQITGTNKMHHTEVVEADYEGYRLQTYIFDAADDSAMRKNLRLTEDLLRRLEPHLRGDSEYPVYAGVQFSEIDRFLSEFHIHKNFTTVHEAARKWTREKLPDVPWNIAVASGSLPGKTLENTPTPVPPVSRSPFRSDSTIGGPRSLNIRALMTGDDMVLDLRRLGTLDRSQVKGGTRLSTMRKARRSEGNGHGLLILYPISRNSPRPSNPSASGVRASMQEKLADLRADPAAAADESQPIMGYAMLLPYDVAGVLEPMGTFVSVVPDPVLRSKLPEEDSKHEAIEDHEADYHG